MGRLEGKSQVRHPAGGGNKFFIITGVEITNIVMKMVGIYGDS